MSDEELAITEKALKEMHEAFTIADTAPKEIDKELVATMYRICINYKAITERMNHFEAWFTHYSDRLNTMEKQIGSLQQKMMVWIDGRGGKS